MPPSDLVRAARSAGVRDPRVLDALRVVPSVVSTLVAHDGGARGALVQHVPRALRRLQVAALQLGADEDDVGGV